MMRLLLVIFLVFPFAARAGCNDIGHTITGNTFINVSDNDCSGPLAISVSDKDNNTTSYPFEQECKASDDFSSFSCRADGHTPLAGTSYRIEQFGSKTIDCTDMAGGKMKVPRLRYVCFSGCGKSAPKYLYKTNQGCD